MNECIQLTYSSCNAFSAPPLSVHLEIICRMSLLHLQYNYYFVDSEVSRILQISTRCNYGIAGCFGW